MPERLWLMASTARVIRFRPRVHGYVVGLIPSVVITAAPGWSAAIRRHPSLVGRCPDLV